MNIKKFLHYYVLAAAAVCTIGLLASYSGTDKGGASFLTLSSSSSNDEDRLPQMIRAVSMKKDFTFAGERLPTENFDVRERLERELLVTTYQHSATLLNMKKAARYFPLFEKVFKEKGIPDDFKYMAVAESNLTNAVSSAGARGIWQFMQSAAGFYGLEVSEDVDERYHPEKATEAAAKFILDHHKRFGSWTLAAASYNVGGTRISKELAAQGVQSYYDLQINEETSRYVFRLMAYKAILENPEAFGYYVDKEEKYPPLDRFKTVEVNTAIPDLAKFALEQGTNLRLLKLYNPWLISTKLGNPSKKTYSIKIPK